MIPICSLKTYTHIYFLLYLIFLMVLKLFLIFIAVAVHFEDHLKIFPKLLQINIHATLFFISLKIFFK